MTIREVSFWSRVNRLDPDACWLWQGRRKNGYGTFYWKGKEYYAHRIAFELTHNYIPKDQVLHDCDVRLCCNPKHLHEGSHDDNMREMRERHRSASGENHSQAKLNRSNVRLIRKLGKTKTMSLTAIGKQFGVSRSQIRNILKERHWCEHVPAKVIDVPVDEEVNYE